MSVALVNPGIITWARNRCYMSTTQLARKLSKDTDNLEKWESGDAKPTFKQAQKLAHILHIPFGYLYLKQPPEETQLTPDLRTVDNNGSEVFSVDLKDVIADVIRKQDWYRDHLIDNGAQPLDFIGKYSISSPAKDIVSDITEELKLSIEDRDECSNGEVFLRMLMSHCEEAGIWIMRNGKVGSNTHRILDIEEFRGFAISDPYAPVVFINGVDAKPAQIFTLAHELAHLWIGESGVSNPCINTIAGYSRVEKLCNQVAAELLVPEHIINYLWQANDELHENSERLAKHFRVSSIVVARRALDLGLTNRKNFFSYYKLLMARWRKAKENRGPGGNFYNSLPIANGPNFTDTVLHNVYSGNMLMRDGARLLGVKPSTMNKYAKEIGVV